MLGREMGGLAEQIGLVSGGRRFACTIPDPTVLFRALVTIGQRRRQQAPVGVQVTAKAPQAQATQESLAQIPGAAPELGKGKDSG